MARPSTRTGEIAGRTKFGFHVKKESKTLGQRTKAKLRAPTNNDPGRFSAGVRINYAHPVALRFDQAPAKEIAPLTYVLTAKILWIQYAIVNSNLANPDQKRNTLSKQSVRVLLQISQTMTRVICN